MTVRFRVRKPEPEPEISEIPVAAMPEEILGEATLENDCFKAIEAWVNGARFGTLMIVHRENGAGFELTKAEMLDDEGQLWRVSLLGSNDVELRPRFSPRENSKYRPVWR